MIYTSILPVHYKKFLPLAVLPIIRFGIISTTLIVLDVLCLLLTKSFISIYYMYVYITNSRVEQTMYITNSRVEQTMYITNSRVEQTMYITNSRVNRPCI